MHIHVKEALENSTSSYLHNKIRKIVLILGLEVGKEKWIESEDEDYCFWMENFLTTHYGLKNEGGILCNVIHGGNAPPKMTPEARKKAHVTRSLRALIRRKRCKSLIKARAAKRKKYKRKMKRRARALMKLACHLPSN